MKHGIRFLGVLLLVGLTARAQRIEVDWPTPSTALAEGRPIAEFLQHAGTGDPMAGAFGCVRSNGRQFHEGIDIQPVSRDRRGEATDPVFAALDGVVSHVSTVPGHSSYGRYVVLEHPGVEPAVYTLYAHLAHVAPQIRPGTKVRRGQTLGVMGRSASGYAIPKDRAHLHFEIGLRLTDDFQRWYDSRKFGSKNEHGRYNGYNLMGFDALDFFHEHRAGRVDGFADYIARMPTVVTARIATGQVPDFVRRYPALAIPHPPMLIAGWEITFNATGLPFRWKALPAGEVQGMKRHEIRIVQVDAAEEKSHRCKHLAHQRRGRWEPGGDLEMVLQLLFGLR
jgi:murein DD-endopeptidase MepM/ murein hydrolase activator NlpD